MQSLVSAHATMMPAFWVVSACNRGYGFYLERVGAATVLGLRRCWGCRWLLQGQGPVAFVSSVTCACTTAHHPALQHRHPCACPALPSGTPYAHVPAPDKHDPVSTHSVAQPLVMCSARVRAMHLRFAAVDQHALWDIRRATACVDNLVASHRALRAHGAALAAAATAAAHVGGAGHASVAASASRSAGAGAGAGDPGSVAANTGSSPAGAGVCLKGEQSTNYMPVLMPCPVCAHLFFCRSTAAFHSQ